MNKLILITGELAAGKSTLAKSLGEKLDFIVINKDELKEIVCDIFDYKNREENLLLSKAAMANMFHFLERTVKAKKDIILEANFRNEDIETIKSITKNSNYQIILFYLKGKQEVLYERFLKRMENRHKAHISIGLQNSFEKYKDYNKFIDSQETFYERHIIDMTELNADAVFNLSLNVLKESKMI